MKKNIFKPFLAIFWIFTCFICSSTVQAHDLWLNIDDHSPEINTKTNVKVIFGHNFPYYDILITRDILTEFSYIGPDGKKREITRIWEDRQGERKGALVGEISLAQEGTYVVAASRKIKGDKKHVPSEKYGKSIITVGKATKNLSQPFGHRIEIIPLKDPSEIKAGDSFPVKILFEGKPLSTYVYATYAGYYPEDEPFPVFTKSNEKGVAYIEITKPGIWMVVCNHKVDFSASLTFEIE